MKVSSPADIANRPSTVLPRNRPPSAGTVLFVDWLKREAVAYENNMDQL